MRSSHTSTRSLTTSSPPPCRQLPPGAPAQEAGKGAEPHTPSRSTSPAWSTASTADAGPSPSLPALPAPPLPERILALLQTPPPTGRAEENPDQLGGENADDGRFVTASWGSPYPRSDASHLRLSSLSSEPSDGSPIHHLEIRTPFLRPAPYIQELGDDEDFGDDNSLSADSQSPLPFSVQPTSSLVSATVLANRARRPARGLTEDWIRQHTTGDFGSEARLWLSDNSSLGDSENSSLSGSVSGDNNGYREEDGYSLQTPGAAPGTFGRHSPPRQFSTTQQPRQQRAYHPRHPSSLETLRESDLNRLNRRGNTRRSNVAATNTDAMDPESSVEKPTDSGTADAVAVLTSAANSTTHAETAASNSSVPAAPVTPTMSKSAVVPPPETILLPAPSTPPSKASPGTRRDTITTQPDVSFDPLGDLAVSKMSASPKKTPRRARKKLPWKGKTIMVLLPLDEQRGKPGKAPKPLTQSAVENMLQSWEELGYDIQGFDLDRSISPNDFDYYGLESRSMSRPSWPDEDDTARERAQRKYPVLLPDLNAWKNYVEELNEAKLRALGVSFGDENPPLPPSFSPGPGASISRQSSANVYPPLPFSPPIPTSSASSNHGVLPFTFPAVFPGAAGIVGSSAAQSPSIPSAASPIPFGMGAKYNTRQSISIPAGVFQMPQQTTPGGFSPQALMLQQGLVRGGSPSLAALSSGMSPASPFTPDGSFSALPLHQRHQSLQYPLMQYPQLQSSARASPRLQELREVEEETDANALSKSSSKTPEPITSRPFVQHNASLSLQKEIDDAEYHLEEQFRSQFEHDHDYSPHGGRDLADSFGTENSAKPTVAHHGRGLSVQFAPTATIQRFRDDANGGPPLHHPRPHSRGHSLANAYYVDPEEARSGNGEGSFAAAAVPAPDSTQDASRPDDSIEIETNPSILGTPIQKGLDYSTILMKEQDQTKQGHAPTFSSASNPWSDGTSFSGKPGSTRRPSHGSKPSLSNLNVEAPEFKFNPGASSTFQPNVGGQFFFGNNSATEPFQPAIFQASVAPNPPPSANSSQFSFPTTATTASKINVNAPAFSPGQSEFSFSGVGPKFRPDAPSFTPIHSFSNSLTSPTQSGTESVAGGNRTSSIFGNIDLNITDIAKPAKRSKAVPIVRPSSHPSAKPAVSAEDNENKTEYDNEGRVVDDSRVKRARATPMDDGNDEVLFALPSTDVPVVAAATPEPAVADSATDSSGPDAGEIHVGPTLSEEKAEVLAQWKAPQAIVDVETAWVEDAKEQNEDEGESALAAEDTTLSSTVLSESTDAAKLPATTSPSELSPVPGNVPWAPFEFGSETDMADFNSARPMGENPFRHKKSLSAIAKPFTPGASFTGSLTNDLPDDELDSEHVLPTVEAVDINQKITFHPSPPVSPVAAGFSSPPPAPAPAKEKSRGLAASRYALASSPPPPPKAAGLSGSRYATSSPPPVPTKDVESVEDLQHSPQQELVMPTPEAGLPTETTIDVEPSDADAGAGHEPTFEEIDDIMRHLNEYDPAQGVNKALDSAAWHQLAAPSTHVSLAAVASEAPLNLPAPESTVSYQHIVAEQPQEPILSTELDDPFIDPPLSVADSFGVRGIDNCGNASGGSMPPSEWGGDFAGEEQLKLESRVNLLNGHVNDMVSELLSARLFPLEKSLDQIQHAIASIARGTPSSRRGPRSNSGEVQESDADDEDDEMAAVPHRSMSPRRDRRMEQMRAALLDALATHQSTMIPSQPSPSAPVSSAAGYATSDSVATVLKTLDDIREQFGQSLRLDFRGEDLRNIVEDAVERRMPMTPQPDATSRAADEAERTKKTETLEARIAELEERLQTEEAKSASETATRRATEDQVGELTRKLELAETKIEVEIMNRSVYDQRVADLEDKLKEEEENGATELASRRAAEDRLAEIQRLLRISSEEEMRLRELVDERDAKLKAFEEGTDKDRKQLAVLEASLVNGDRTNSDLQNRLNSVEAELRERAENVRHWRAEAERAIDLSQRQGNDLVQTATELKHMKKVVDTLGVQLEENEQLREAWRSKFVALQEEMARAAREVADETARNIKREQTLIARQEVLEAKLQAEARTRERLESELERLEDGERQAMRAVAECRRLEALLGELRTENHALQQSSLRYQSEFEEARESAAREVQRTRDSMQAEVDEANHQVNVVRGDLEDQMARARGQLDQVKLDADTAKARLEMLLEEAETTKRTVLDEAEAAKRRELDEAERRHQNDVEDLQARYERQINNVAEDAQRSEQNLLERLSISTSRTEHLQDRVAHLEEKLDVAREAAQAAAKAAKTVSGADTMDASSVSSSAPAAALQSAAAVMSVHHGLGLPEKISPQALRESILVLQEQLQQREQRIEELEQELDKVDPEADTKIAKRDDEIIWLRELLAVRHSDLKDIIAALGRDDHDPERVRDAVIRLQANLQMEEQERERAMNGGSAIKLPALAATIRDAATPRVAQAVGPLAAAWGNWRKTRDSNASNMGNTFSSLSGVLLSSPAPASATRRGGAATSSSTTAMPLRAAASFISSRTGPTEPPSGGDSSFLSGLLTPPTSGMRQTPPSREVAQHDEQQPTAFSSTGRRYTGAKAASRRTSHTDNKIAVRDVAATPPQPNFRRSSRSQPVTPPMMRTSAYDSDAQAEEFDDAAFFDD